MAKLSGGMEDDLNEMEAIYFLGLIKKNAILYSILINGNFSQIDLRSQNVVVWSNRAIEIKNINFAEGEFDSVMVVLYGSFTLMEFRTSDSKFFADTRKYFGRDALVRSKKSYYMDSMVVEEDFKDLGTLEGFEGPASAVIRHSNLFDFTISIRFYGDKVGEKSLWSMEYRRLRSTTGRRSSRMTEEANRYFELYLFKKRIADLELSGSYINKALACDSLRPLNHWLKIKILSAKRLNDSVLTAVNDFEKFYDGPDLKFTKGEVFLKLGQRDSSRVNFKKAAHIYDTLLSKDSSNATLILGQIQVTIYLEGKGQAREKLRYYAGKYPNLIELRSTERILLDSVK